MPRQASNNSSPRRNSTPTIYERKISSTQTVEYKAPGILDSMKQGIGLGMGSEIGHRILHSFLGPSVQDQRSEVSYLPVDSQRLYAKCLEKNEGFPEICKPFQTKDKSVWKQCMETNQFNHLECAQ